MCDTKYHGFAMLFPLGIEFKSIFVLFNGLVTIHFGNHHRMLKSQKIEIPIQQFFDITKLRICSIFQFFESIKKNEKK